MLQKSSVFFLIFGLFLLCARPADADCVDESSRMFGFPVSLALAVLEVEGGKIGSANLNKNGTRDYGPAQVNSVHMEKLARFGITEDDLMFNYCLNVHAALYIIRKHYDSLPENMEISARLAEAAGRYHSKTPHIKAAYQGRLLRAALRQQK